MAIVLFGSKYITGMTATSLIPDEARAIGIDYPTLCDNLINISLKKYQ